MTDLELLAPARNADIGIAAIDCGADAVYLAGPEFGARKDAGNSVEDIRCLCDYAHRFGARVFITLNTIIYDQELAVVQRLADQIKEAGADAVIVQDLALTKMTDLPLHASTQCAVRTPEKAKFYNNLGFSRLVLERELSLEQVKAVREAVDCELEFFVHGALCVCYSGQCYMSEKIAGRSANRGECVQACRSLYDLADEDGNILVHNKALLSLRDFKLLERLEELADAGVNSFKIEGRLKNISYVRNVVRAYSSALDNLVARHPDRYRRASFGRILGGFTPEPDKTFNRGYTECFLDGVRGKWSSMDAPKSMGEEIGTVVSCSYPDNSANRKRRGGGMPGTAARDGRAARMTVTVKLKNPSVVLNNGDGFSFIGKERNEIVGFRGDVCQGSVISCKNVPEIYSGARLFRNHDSGFEKELETNLPHRLIPVEVSVEVQERGAGMVLAVRAESQDGRFVALEKEAGTDVAENQERMRSVFASQISKTTGIYSFTLKALTAAEGVLPFLPAQALNGIRREVAECLDEIPCKAVPLYVKRVPEDSDLTSGVDGATSPIAGKVLTYKDNVANRVADSIYRSLGAESVEEAYELSHKRGAELMRTKYCIRHELGMCPVHQIKGSGHPKETGRTKRLFLRNNGKSYTLTFDCRNCEMVVSD